MPVLCKLQFRLYSFGFIMSGGEPNAFRIVSIIFHVVGRCLGYLATLEISYIYVIYRVYI